MGRIAINGLGRIGRAVLKIAIDQPQLDVVAVNDLIPLENLMYLLRYDSIYGKYGRQIRREDDALFIGETRVQFFNVKDPAHLPWGEMNIDAVLECTGVFANTEGLQKHLDAGARYAVLSAPSKSEGMRTVVPGVNHATADDRMFSTASCTTNCITPVVEVMARRIGIDEAIMTTVHAYTSTQQIVDGPSKKLRRGRAGAINFVPTTTGAAKATTIVLPDLQNRFDGVAIRGPVPVGSIADLVFAVSRDTTVDEINTVFREECDTDRYRNIMGVSDDHIVSSDIIGDPRASVVDLTMTKTVGKLVKVMSWYDNEWGYAAQMVREVAGLPR